VIIYHQVEIIIFILIKW